MATPPSKITDTEEAHEEVGEIIQEASRTAVEAALSKGRGAAELKKYADMKNGRDRAVRAKLEQGVALLLENEQLQQGGGETTQSNFAERAQQIMDEFLTNEDFFGSFCEYISGLRWSTDQNNFIHALFEHGTDFNASFLDQNLKPEHLSSLACKLKLPIEYSERPRWNRQTVAKILKAHPELDYRRLKDAKFAQSSEGVKLQAAYQKLSGDIRCQESYHISPIPLSKFPFVEAIIVDEVSDYGPTDKYAMGPEPWVREIWQSDSVKAQEALVARTSTRLPEDERNTIDCPTEFENKGCIIGNLRLIYGRNAFGEEAHEKLRAHLLTILESYTFDGPIAASVREEDRERISHSYYPPVEAGEIQKIVGGILESLLTDSDAQARETAETIMNKYAMAQRLEMPLAAEGEGQGDEGVLVEKDVLVFDKADQQIVLMNALGRVDDETDPAVFERMGKLAFGPEAATQLRKLAEERISILPKIYPPRGADREQCDAWYETHGAEAERLRTDYQCHLNLFLVQEVEGMVAEEESGAFKDFVKKISLPEHNAVGCEEYCRLVSVGKDSRLNARDKTTVLYEIGEKLKYEKIKDVNALQKAILDLLEIYLGPTSLTAEELEEYSRDIFNGYILDIAKMNAGALRAINDQAFWATVEGYNSKVRSAIEAPVQEDDQKKEKYHLKDAGRLLEELLKLRSAEEQSS